MGQIILVDNKEEAYIYLCFTSMCVDTCIYSRTIAVGIGASTWYFSHIKILLALVNLDVCVSARCVKLVIFNCFLSEHV
jgi:hypothetical protein